MNPWIWEDPVALDSHQMVHNPRTMSSPFPLGFDTSGLAGMGSRAQPRAHEWTFSGRVRSEAEEDALRAWLARPNELLVTDHLARQFRVLVKSAEFIQSLGGRFRSEYTVTVYVLEAL